jgi:ubiquitin conjugation factor E4 B
MGPFLSSSPLATTHLLHGLIQFYCDIEHTGEHNQFFDKFNIRYEIFSIIDKVWENPTYRKNLSEESRVNHDLFVKFVNLLLNDSTYVLDEAFTALGKIHTLQHELTLPETADSTRAQRQENLETQERMASSYLGLVNETLKMLKKFTGAIKNSFTVASIVSRLAAMLNLNLVTLVGPRGAELNVMNPEKYNFRPKQLLADLVAIYLHLGTSSAFIDAVVNDGRSYKPEIFNKTIATLSKNDLVSPDAIRAFQKFTQDLITAKETLDQGEEELGDDIPDEFLDPLLFSLMTDPVILPTSRTSIDRSTIESHLLSFPHDPFNRQPLTLDQVVPDVELRAKIEEWVKEKRAKGKAVPEELAVVADQEAAARMDTEP